MDQSNDPGTHLPYVEKMLENARENDAEAFFRGKLAGVEEATAPFGLLEVSACHSHLKAREGLEFALSQRLRQQAQCREVGMSALLHAAWSAVLCRASGREEVVYGCELASGLEVDGTDRVPSIVTNILPLRLTLRNVSVVELLAQAHRELTELSAREKTSLSVLRRSSGIPPAALQIGAVLSCPRNGGDCELEQRLGVDNIRLIARYDRAKYPIFMTVEDSGGDMALDVNTDGRVSPCRIAGYMSMALRSLVEALESAPQTPALALAIVPDSERHQILESFNSTQASVPSDKLVHQLFEEQVERTPQAIALVHEEQQLTYVELNARANQLAGYLRCQGVGADQLVALCVERSLDMVVGLLGILKAGGAYMPLDPAYPAERLAHMMESAAPRVLLTQERLTGALPHTNAAVITLDTKWDEIEQHSVQNLSAAEPNVTSKHLVYVIYTSGSTGKPKGTAMAHSSMVNLMEWHRSALRRSEGQRVLQFAALGFDVAFQEIFSTLCTGGTLVLLSEYTRKNPRALAEFLVDRSIHRLFVPPLVLQSLAECFRTFGRAPVGEQLRISP
jgi:non-ribosomal peptide synthetase component F